MRPYNVAILRNAMPDVPLDQIPSPRPPAEALRWVADAVGRGARVTSVRRLRGATSSALHAIDVTDAQGGRHSLVLRRFPHSRWLAREPDLAEREARVLALLRDTDIPAPELVAVDPAGKACDVPAVLMTRLPGRVELAPKNMDAWLTSLAAALPSIHAVTAPPSVQPYRPYHTVDELEAPAWSHQKEAWARALDILVGPAPDDATVFIHRDYHPTNVLWARGRISGVIDWTNASRGPAGIDAGHCRRNLASLHGVVVADRFLSIYESITASGAHHPYWDLITLVDCLPEPGVYSGWTDHGVRGLTTELVRARLDDYISTVVGRL